MTEAIIVVIVVESGTRNWWQYLWCSLNEVSSPEAKLICLDSAFLIPSLPSVDGKERSTRGRDRENCISLWHQNRAIFFHSLTWPLHWIPTWISMWIKKNNWNELWRMAPHADNFHCFELHNVIPSEWMNSTIWRHLRRLRICLSLNLDWFVANSHRPCVW